MCYSLFIKGNLKSFSFLTDGRYKVTLSKVLKVFVVRWDSYCHTDESIPLIIYVVLVNHLIILIIGMGSWLRGSLPNLSIMCIMH
jgi:hypothetical protein